MAQPIGSLVASLQLESAAFIRDLGKAAAAVNSNTARMTRSFQGIERAAKSAFAGYLGMQGVRALANIAQAAIDTGDEIGEASSKLGIGAEALQRLRFAAAQTDVDVVSLNNAMKQFQKQLATGQITASTGDIAGAFEEWITKIREAPTQLDKVAIAVKAFAKQYQSALLIAAQGETFTDAMKGAFVISEQGVAIASELDNKLRALRNAAAVGFQTGFLEAFVGKLDESGTKLEDINSAMAQLGGIVGGIVVRLAAFIDKVSSFLAAHPNFLRFALDPTLGVGSLQVAGAMQGAPAAKGAGRGTVAQPTAEQAQALIGPWTTVTTAVDAATAAVGRNAEATLELLKSVGASLSPLEEYHLTLEKIASAGLEGADRLRAESDAVLKLHQDQQAQLASLGVAISPMEQYQLKTEQIGNAQLDAEGKARALTAATYSLHEAIANQLESFGVILSPLEQYNLAIEKITASNMSAADAARANAAVQRNYALSVSSNWIGAAGAVTGALTDIFKQNKAVAVADAIVNTAAAVVAALKNPPGPPFSYVYAAAAAATGAAQIATILAANPGSGARAPTLKGGKSSATAAAGKGAGSSSSGAQAPAQVVTIKIEGDVFGPEHFRKIVAGINGVQRDGTALLQVA